MQPTSRARFSALILRFSLFHFFPASNPVPACDSSVFPLSLSPYAWRRFWRVGDKAVVADSNVLEIGKTECRLAMRGNDRVSAFQSVCKFCESLANRFPVPSRSVVPLVSARFD
ncbi:hypothetical protein BCR34DRAFT_255873 [Clohesyomyces aquaticus]|uniref:Secreted protein n=1 Tax=Clohesyomyces aquaticus TaxID=1231657 RepID=A0A1Y1ZU24_9PLEO|nr:hypothetical protein BCR34DRAFT_255873 [Clohesyomyces aquaticus]